MTQQQQYEPVFEMLKNTLFALVLTLPALAWADPSDPVFISNVPQMVEPLPDPIELPTASRPAAEKPGAPRINTFSFVVNDEGTAAFRRDLKLRSAAALVVSQDHGELLYAKNTDAVMPIASITKLMTAMVVLDSGLPLEEEVTIEPGDVDVLKGTRSRLKVGVMLTRRELLKLALMASENRAAAALARAYPGGVSTFVQAMNAKARELGMRDTRFLDSTGLNPGNVSTAHDLALMVHGGYQYPLIREFTTSESHRIATTDRRHRVVAFRNSNGLVRSHHWEIGLSKTGYISEAGRCLVMQATIAAKPVIIVLLDSWGKLSRIADANRIKRWVERLDPAPAVITNKPRMG
jgi:serine-type D-Ala-D-Ala endopeptidase (penicillin-binding protein 7)